MVTKATEIDAIKWFFGYDTTEAEAYYCKAGKKLLADVVRSYIGQMNNNFYDE